MADNWPTEHELRDATATVKLAPIQRQLDVIIDSLPRWQRSAFRLTLRARRLVSRW